MLDPFSIAPWWHIKRVIARCLTYKTEYYTLLIDALAAKKFPTPTN